MSIKAIIRIKDGIKEVNLNASKAIVLKCADCSNFQYIEVNNCTDENCPLYHFRNKHAKDKIREEQGIKKKKVSQKTLDALDKSRKERFEK